MQYDYLVVGSGLFGAVFAQQAKAKGKKVLVDVKGVLNREKFEKAGYSYWRL